MTAPDTSLQGAGRGEGGQPFERFRKLSVWVERLACANIEGLSLYDWQEFTDELNRVADVAGCAIDLIEHGLKNDGHALCVIERSDKSDPHYKLCTSVERVRQ